MPGKLALNMPGKLALNMPGKLALEEKNEKNENFHKILSTMDNASLQKLIESLGLPLPTDFETDFETKLKNIKVGHHPHLDLSFEKANLLVSQGYIMAIVNNPNLLKQLKDLLIVMNSSQAEIEGGKKGGAIQAIKNVKKYFTETKDNMGVITVATAALFVAYPFNNYIETLNAYFQAGGYLEGLKPFLTNMGVYAASGFLLCSTQINKLIECVEKIKTNKHLEESCKCSLDIILAILTTIGPYILPESIYNGLVRFVTGNAEKFGQEIDGYVPSYYIANIQAIIMAIEVIKSKGCSKFARVEQGKGGSMKRKKSKRKSKRSKRRSNRSRRKSRK